MPSIQGKMPWKKVFFSHPKGDKNKKGSPLRPQYLVNLKSNTMKDTVQRIILKSSKSK